ncbi:MAG: hypothetical protein M3O34_02075 [Chloroflexota bacterium]|nr:hypothetical protein [Chloroflexota bacterium]
MIGTVRPFVLTEIEDELRVDLADHLLADREGAPVIVADWIDLIPGTFDNPLDNLFDNLFADLP